ncbi:ATP synthase F1 subunit epsilon [Leptolinea tardivitalis]|uniref:ATP synthase epsilon chain n=1 Tax=Leptolinea tardivitalis TaxID=229920 RepID=A0A0P6WYR4_9CHLR|nr:ATP synthase F1 subunit epsilon [Leptolinea tardivitalis]KPL71729.1 ATP synthase F0F1 subunit epsilon [Leptolinea tardivitalis]GAP20088.1 ATP synthase F1 subcomplex epsilon subunit [Leptolinea tardivitalis]
MPIRCEVVSQDRIVFQGDVDIVNLPGLDGDMGILPNHSPVLTLLRYGVISIKTKTDEQFFTVAGGVAEVQPDQVTILADAAENVDEIDIQRAESARKRAEEALAKTPQTATDEYLAIQAAMRRSNLRLDAARRFKSQKRTH